MTVLVNGEPLDVDEQDSVEAVVTTLACGRSGVAVAVNGEVVPRSQWGDRRLAAGDHVEVLTAAQGG